MLKTQKKTKKRRKFAQKFGFCRTFGLKFGRTELEVRPEQFGRTSAEPQVLLIPNAEPPRANFKFHKDGPKMIELLLMKATFPLK